MTRKEMMDKAIRRYGFEHTWVVAFCTYCDIWEDTEWNNKCLADLFNAMMNYIAEDEDENESFSDYFSKKA